MLSRNMVGYIPDNCKKARYAWHVATSSPRNQDLAWHFKNSKTCANTLAAHRFWPKAPPAFGSKTVRQLEDNAPLQVWQPTNVETLPRRAGWPMTRQTREFLKIVCRCTWSDKEIEVQALRTALGQYAVSYYELSEVRDAMAMYYDEPEIRTCIQQTFDVLQEEARHVTTYKKTRCWIWMTELLA